MRSRGFRFWLLLAVMVGAASCELNPQPPLPGNDELGNVGAGGTKMASEGQSAGSAVGGSLALDPGAAGTSSPGVPVIGAGGSQGDDAESGGAPAGDAGAGGATDAGAGGAGAGGAVDVGPK